MKRKAIVITVALLAGMLPLAPAASAFTGITEYSGELIIEQEDDPASPLAQSPTDHTLIFQAFEVLNFLLGDTLKQQRNDLKAEIDGFGGEGRDHLAQPMDIPNHGDGPIWLTLTGATQGYVIDITARGPIVGSVHVFDNQEDRGLDPHPITPDCAWQVVDPVRPDGDDEIGSTGHLSDLVGATAGSHAVVADVSDITGGTTPSIVQSRTVTVPDDGQGVTVVIDARLASSSLEDETGAEATLEYKITEINDGGLFNADKHTENHLTLDPTVWADVDTLNKCLQNPPSLMANQAPELGGLGVPTDALMGASLPV